MKKYQSEIVIEQLRKTGKVSRNWCLSRQITRLGAIVANLISDGWKFDDTPSKTGKEIMRGKFIKNDYWYFVVHAPNAKSVFSKK